MPSTYPPCRDCGLEVEALAHGIRVVLVDLRTSQGFTLCPRCFMRRDPSERGEHPSEQPSAQGASA